VWSFWPGVDKWPPPAWVWVGVALMAFVVTPTLILLGSFGEILLGIIIVCFLALGAKSRLKNMHAEEFWDSRPKD